MQNTSGKQVQVLFQKKIPVFCVIWRLVIICLHLGSITSLFLFCFKHCNMFFESASGQNRYKKIPKTQQAASLKALEKKKKTQTQPPASNSCKGIFTCPTERYRSTLPSVKIWSHCIQTTNTTGILDTVEECLIWAFTAAFYMVPLPVFISNLKLYMILPALPVW